MDNLMQMKLYELCLDRLRHIDAAKDDPYETPLGSKDNSPNGNESESIEVVETPNTFRGPLQESTISSASTNNTDICVLDYHHTNEDSMLFLTENFAEVEGHESDDDELIKDEAENDDIFLHDVDVLDKHEDFTLLQKPTNTGRSHCNCDESTEVLMLIDSEYQEKRKPTYSATDSDVEVLMSEEIIESDWSSLEDNPKESAILKKTTHDFKSEQEVSSPSCLQQSCGGSSFKTQASTDFDVSGEELIGNENDNYNNFSRAQLLEIIQKQELCIQALEATVESYQKSQQRMFEHVDALRSELSEMRLTPFQIIEKTKQN